MSIVDLINEWAENSEISPLLIGVTDGHWTTSEYNDRIAVVYDEAKVISIIAEDMEPMGEPDNPDDEYNDPYFLAVEHFNFNFKGAWMGEHTPIFINTFLDERQEDG